MNLCTPACEFRFLKGLEEGQASSSVELELQVFFFFFIPCGCLELDSDPLEAQRVFLTTEPPLPLYMLSELCGCFRLAPGFCVEIQSMSLVKVHMEWKLWVWSPVLVLSSVADQLRGSHSHSQPGEGCLTSSAGYDERSWDDAFIWGILFVCFCLEFGSHYVASFLQGSRDSRN